MTQGGCWTAGKYGSQPAAMTRRLAVADRIDADMNTMQAAGPHPVPDGTVVEAEITQLAPSDHAVLTLRD
jgi:hypothetical protein